MPVSIANAISAYAKAAAEGLSGLASRGTGKPGGDFAGLLKQAAGEAVATVKQSEAVSMQAAAGKADLTEVVTAVANAELTLQTAVAIRDKVIAAYQDIVRMPL